MFASATIFGPSRAAYSAGMGGVPRAKRSASSRKRIGGGSKPNGLACAIQPVKSGSSFGRSAGSTYRNDPPGPPQSPTRAGLPAGAVIARLGAPARKPVRPPGLDELTPRDEHPATAPGESNRQGKSGRVVVGDERILAAGQGDQVLFGDVPVIAGVCLIAALLFTLLVGSHVREQPRLRVHRRMPVLAVALAATLVGHVVMVAWPAQGAEVTRVVSAMDGNNRFDFNLTATWIHDVKSAFASRPISLGYEGVSTVTFPPR